MRRRGKSQLVAGAPGAAILPELHKRDRHVEIRKTRFSAFFRTSLDDVLGGLGVDHVVVVGVNTMSCVRTTAVDAYMRDLAVTLVVDGVAAYDDEQHRDSMRYMAYSCAQVLTVCETVALLGRSGRCAG